MFTLTTEQQELSLNIYGKIIRCIIAPYHNFVQYQTELLTVMGSDPGSVYVFPERDLTIQQRKGLVDTFVKSNLREVNFITSDLFIISDMINDCCRLLNPDTNLEDVTTKTFLANHHDIILSVLQNEWYDKQYKTNISNSKDLVNAVITEINSATTITATRGEELLVKIKLIGESLIRNKLAQMLNDKIV